MHGYTVAFAWGLGVLILATVLSFALVTKQRPASGSYGTETALEPAEELGAIL